MTGRDWIAVHTPGHTLDHLCLLDPAEGLLLAGDHVLPTITPHVSGLAAGADPLANFLASLDKVRALEGVRLVLPAHGDPFADMTGRIDAIRRHHRERLDAIHRATATAGRATVETVTQQVFHPAPGDTWPRARPTPIWSTCGIRDVWRSTTGVRTSYMK